MSNRIVPLFYAFILLLAVALFITFVTGKVDMEEIPENEIIDVTFHFHGEVPPDIVDFLVDLEENEETGDCSNKQKTGEQ
jgi:hypothetical protein